MTDRLATVIGGSGFIGRHVVRALLRHGWRVRVAVRRPDLAGHLQPLGGVGQVHAVQANVRYPESVLAACEDADAVVNLAGLLYESGRQSFDAVHVFGARAAARAARERGAARLVHVSAIGAARDAPAEYARTKAAGEAEVTAGCPGATILRPSVVFGPEDRFFNMFASLARITPVLPLIGGGATRLQPVFVGDVAMSVCRVLEDGKTGGRVYELGGPQVATLREIMQFILHTTGRRRLLVPLPFELARIQALFLQLLPKPILTVDQVRLLEVDNVVSEAATGEKRTLQGLGIDPRSHEGIVAEYLARFRKAGQFTQPRPREDANGAT